MLNFCPPLFLLVSRADFPPALYPAGSAAQLAAQRASQRPPLRWSAAATWLGAAEAIWWTGHVGRIPKLQFENDESVDGMKCPIFSGTNPYLTIAAFV